MKKALSLFTSSAIALMTLSHHAVAEAPAATTGATTAATVAAPAQTGGSVIGILDVRPSYTSGSGEFHLENAIEAGYKFSKSAKVSAQYAFNNNMFNPKGEGEGFSSVHAFIRASFSGVADFGNGFTLNYQPRAYIPVSTADTNAGLVTNIRNYFTLVKKFNDSFTMSLSEIPIVRVYKTAGFTGANGPQANPAFENRIYLEGEIQLTEKLSLSLPVMFHTTFHRDYQVGAAKNSATTFFLWINPELSYAANDNLTVGIGYYSDNLVAPDLSAGNFGKGLEDGVTQLFVTANL